MDFNKIEYTLNIPFKNFMPGQIIDSKQFNDDMYDIEDKINEIISKHNINDDHLYNHISDKNNPHEVLPEQIGTYNYEEINFMYDNLKAGYLNDNAITNRVMGDNSVDNRNIVDNSITAIKVDNSFGSQIDISNNIDVVNRYTKEETDQIFDSKVGNGTYSKEVIDDKFAQVQAGQIIDSTIGVEKLKSNVGMLLDISKNPSILGRYSNADIDSLIRNYGMPRDWGSIVDDTGGSTYGFLPVADYMVVNEFVAPLTDVLDLNVREVVDARNTYPELSERLDTIEDTLVSILEMFSEVNSNG